MNLRILVSLLVLGCAAACGVSSAEDPPVFELKWGSFGSGPGQFHHPGDVKSDAAGNIYVADTENKRIQKFTNNGAYLGELDAAPSGPAAFGYTGSCAIDAAANLYLPDTRGFIDVFDASFNFVRNWPASAQYLALDPTEHFLYVTAVYDSIVKYDVATGTRVGGWRYVSPGSYGFAVGASGDIYISQGESLAKFSPAGTLLKTWGSLGNGDGQLNGARGVVVDASENVYVADGGNGRVQKFTSDGVFLSSWGSYGGGDGQFSNELDALTTDAAGSIFVLDHTLERIQKFVYPSTPVLKGTWGGLKTLYR